MIGITRSLVTWRERDILHSLNKLATCLVNMFMVF